MFYRRHEGITSKGDFNSISNDNKLVNIIMRIRKSFTEKNIKNSSNNLKKLRYYNWSILVHQNYLNSKHKIKKNYNVDTNSLALKITKTNFFKRLLIICRLIQRGYYKNRSGIFSILIDLFFPNS
jgi:transcription elongation factor GreA-like protein